MNHTEADLNAALDSDPGDALTRLALADWYEEQGRMDEATEQRWLVSVVKYPTGRPSGGARSWHPDEPWDWWQIGADAPPHATLPDEFFYPDDGTPHRGRYASRRVAEADYLAHARRAKLLTTEGLPA